MRSARHPIVLLSLGYSYVHIAYLPQRVLRNDSVSDEKWPRTKAIILGRIRSKKHEAEDSPVKESIESHLSNNPVASKVEEHALPSEEDGSAWAQFSSRVQLAASAMKAISWPDLGDTLSDFIFPSWAKLLPEYISKFQRELDIAPGSLADEIWREAQDPDINPEIAYVATVRIGKDLCQEEKLFRQRRKRHTARALARYLDIPENEVHPDDVPTIAMCGSGGGLRAMVASCGSYLSAQEAGLFDCVTYTAGVSGSCWLQALYYSSIGKQNHQKIVDHLKCRIGTHIAFPPSALELLTTAPTNKFLLSGFVEKFQGDPKADLGVVDIYGLLLAARLLVPRFDLQVDSSNLKLSSQRVYLERGRYPLPIYTAVRHEIPLEEMASQDEPIDEVKVKEKAKKEAWFQWFEFTPYEFFCEELDAGIPSWGVGRRYQNGSSIAHENNLQLPEYRLPLLMGIWGSAFCATLAHYYKEIRPVVQGFAGFIGIDSLIQERTDELAKVHPVEPASIPNFVLGLRDQLPRTCPESIFRSEHLQLADAGMSNNLPLYPLLREGRDVDILIAFDSSADIKNENWLSVADGYAKQRGIKGWPIGAGWPKETAPAEQTIKGLDQAEAKTAEEAATKLAAVQATQTQATPQPAKPTPTPTSTHPTSTSTPTPTPPHPPRHQNPSPSSSSPSQDLTHCNIWVGTTLARTSESEPPPSKLLTFSSPSPSSSSSSSSPSPSPSSSSDSSSAQWAILSPTAGLTVIYFPLLPNPAVEGVDPNSSEFLSTWNFVYSAAEIEAVIALARANFEEGREKTRRVVRAVYERKKGKRERRERGEGVGV